MGSDPPDPEPALTPPTLGSRAWFPDLQARAYLNHASVSPPSLPVRRAVDGLLQTYAELGVGAFFVAVEQRDRLKTKLATLLGCSAEDLALTGSTNRGLIDLSVCLPFAEGDRIVCFDREFPANITPWKQAAAAVGGQVVLVAQEGRTDDEVLADLDAVLHAGPVALVAVSAVQYSTGRAMPLAAITERAHAHGALVCVDGIQAAGVAPVDLSALGVDFFAGGGHKWLMGLEGTGYVYAAPHAVDRLVPRTAGWLSHTDPIDFLVKGPGHLDYDRPIRRSIDFLEGHSQNALGAAALEASLDGLLALGIDAIHAHVDAYNDALEAGLVARGFRSLRTAAPSGTLSVLPPAGHAAIAVNGKLGELGVSASAPDGKLRFSPHWPNPLDEVERVLEAVDAALR